MSIPVRIDKKLKGQDQIERDCSHATMSIGSDLSDPEKWKRWVESWIELYHEHIDEDDHWLKGVEWIRPSETHSHRDFRIVIEDFNGVDTRIELLNEDWEVSNE